MKLNFGCVNESCCGKLDYNCGKCPFCRSEIREIKKKTLKMKLSTVLSKMGIAFMIGVAWGFFLGRLN